MRTLTAITILSGCALAPGVGGAGPSSAHGVLVSATHPSPVAAPFHHTAPAGSHAAPSAARVHPPLPSHLPLPTSHPLLPTNHLLLPSPSNATGRRTGAAPVLGGPAKYDAKKGAVLGAGAMPHKG